jgi:hypothetical protein
LKPLQHIINDIISTLEAIKASEDNNSGKINYSLNVEIEYFRRKDMALKILFQKPDPEFYEICDKVRTRVSKFPMRFVDSPQIRKSGVISDLIESTTKSINTIIRPIQPTISTALNYLKFVKQTLNLVIGFAGEVIKSTPQEKRDQKYESFIVWYNKIIEVFNSFFHIYLGTS